MPKSIGKSDISDAKPIDTAARACYNHLIDAKGMTDRGTDARFSAAEKISKKIQEIYIMANKKAIAAMSGGVDSSVTAYLLSRLGYDVIGVTLRLIGAEHADDALSGTSAEAEDARAVCEKLGMEHRTIDFTNEFRENVIERFCSAYLNGFTPNPCVECNKYIKFDKMLECVKVMDCDAFATGHYARIERGGSGRFLLKKAADLSKDQSYFLYSLSQEQLSKVLFPLGTLTKAEVREIAEEQGLVTARKKDSQDICFIPDGDFAGFIKRYKELEPMPGRFIDSAGVTLGEHSGAYMFTIGQRKGLGIALGKPAYVLSTDISANTVTLGENDELFRRRLEADEVNLIAADRLDTPVRVEAKIRYSHKTAAATAVQTGDDRLMVEFDEPQRAITPGQSVVLYDGDTVIGGGKVKRALD